MVILYECSMIANTNQAIPSSSAVFTILYTEHHQNVKAGTVNCAGSMSLYLLVVHPVGLMFKELLLIQGTCPI